MLVLPSGEGRGNSHTGDRREDERPASERDPVPPRREPGGDARDGDVEPRIRPRDQGDDDACEHHADQRQLPCRRALALTFEERERRDPVGGDAGDGDAARVVGRKEVHAERNEARQGGERERRPKSRSREQPCHEEQRDGQRPRDHAHHEHRTVDVPRREQGHEAVEPARVEAVVRPARLQAAVVRRLVLTRRRALRLEGEAHESRAEGREDEHTLDPRSHLDARPAADARVAGRAPDRGEVEVVVGAAAHG